MSQFVEDPIGSGLYILVDDVIGTPGTSDWHTVESVRVFWPDAPDDPILETLLEVSKRSIIAYAPEIPADSIIPLTYLYAQVMQCRNIWNASTVSTGGDFGNGEFTYEPKPLDWHVKQMLRPKTGVPRVY